MIPRYVGALFTKVGRIWLEKVSLPKDVKAMLFRHDLDRQLA